MRLVAFIHQKPYERILYQIRRHTITVVPPLIGFFILLLVPFALGWFIHAAYPMLLQNEIAYALLLLAASVYLLLIVVFAYTYFVTFYLNLLILTNDRLLYIEQQGLFSRIISELDLYRIQDITSEMEGVFASVFHYGTLLLQTAGKMEEFNIKNVPQPENLRKIILDLAESDRKFHPPSST